MSEKTITNGTKEMPDHIYNLAVLAKKKTEYVLENRIIPETRGETPENYSHLISVINDCCDLVKYVIANGSFTWDVKNKCWIFFYPATRDVMRDIAKENPDLDMFADENSVKPPKRMYLRTSYVEEETRGVNGYTKSLVTRTIVWED